MGSYPFPKGDLPIYARRFNLAGTPYGEVFQVGTVTNGHTTVSVSYGADGRFAFAWPTLTGKAMVRAYRSNEFSPFGIEQTANSFSTFGGTVVSARYNSRNELLVVWGRGSAGSVTNAIYMRRYDPNLVAVAHERQVNEIAPAKNWSVGLGLGANDEAFISWDSSKNRIVGRLMDQNGDALGHEFTVNQSTNGPCTLGWEASKHTAVLGNGNLVAAWSGNGASGSGIYLTFFKRLADTTSPAKPNR